MGLSADDAEAVLQHSLAQQSLLQQLEIADVVLDTEGESPEAVTQHIKIAFGRETENPPSR